MKLMLLFISIPFFLQNVFSQQIKYADLLNIKNIPDSINPNATINCEKYLKIEDKVQDDSWVHKYLSLAEILGGYDSIESLIKYPTTTHRCGKNKCIAYLRFVVNSNGNIFCHEILSSLPQEFINEIEKIIPLLKFKPAISIDKMQVPCDVVYKYEFKKN